MCLDRIKGKVVFSILFFLIFTSRIGLSAHDDVQYDNGIQHYSVLIMGSGPAGCTAAIYLKRSGLEPLVLTGPILGGPLMQHAEKIANWPGVTYDITGRRLMSNMIRKLKKLHVNITQDSIKSVDFQKHPFLINGEKARYSTFFILNLVMSFNGGI